MTEASATCASCASCAAVGGGLRRRLAAVTQKHNRRTTIKGPFGANSCYLLPKYCSSPVAGGGAKVFLCQIHQVDGSDGDHAAQTEQRGLPPLLWTHHGAPCGRSRKCGVPEGHGGEQGEDARLEDFMPQTVGEPLTGRLLLDVLRLTGVRIRRWGPAAVFRGPSAGRSSTL